jgi:DNA-binding transcriptional MerR regulator
MRIRNRAADTGMTMGAQETFTIDELAAAAGMTPRNVRAYRTKGLLTPPIRVGRISRYQLAHLRRLRDIRQLREAGLPLKMIIDAAARGEDLGPNGALWHAAGASEVTRGKQLAPAGVRLPVDSEAFAVMQALTDSGLPPATVLLLALRTAHASTQLAADLRELLDLTPPTQEDPDLEPADLDAADLVQDDETDEPGVTVTSTGPEPSPNAAIIDLATVITRDTLGHAL